MAHATLEEDPQLFRNFLGHSIRQLQEPFGSGRIELCVSFFAGVLCLGRFKGTPRVKRRFFVVDSFSILVNHRSFRKPAIFSVF